MNLQHIVNGVIIVSILMWLIPNSKTEQKRSFPFQTGYIVQLKGTKLRGIIMNIHDGEKFIWWEDQSRYDPFESSEKHGDNQYWYRSDQLLLSSDIDLKIPIYRQINVSVPETKMIGTYVCTKIKCSHCFQIYAVWQSRLILTESLSALWDKTYDELIKAGYTPQQTINLTDPDSCIYVGVCRLARKEPVPDYCLRF